jgi:hypothetical protein
LSSLFLSFSFFRSDSRSIPRRNELN